MPLCFIPLRGSFPWKKIVRKCLYLQCLVLLVLSGAESQAVLQWLPRFSAAVHQRTGNCSCFPILSNASWPVILIFFFPFFWYWNMILCGFRACSCSVVQILMAGLMGCVQGWAHRRGRSLQRREVVLFCFGGRWAKMSALPPQLFIQRLSLSTPAPGLIISSSRIEA